MGETKEQAKVSWKQMCKDMDDDENATIELPGALSPPNVLFDEHDRPVPVWTDLVHAAFLLPLPVVHPQSGPSSTKSPSKKRLSPM